MTTKEKIEKIIEDCNDGNIYYLDAIIELREYRTSLKYQLEMISKFEANNHDYIANAANEHQNEYSGFSFETRKGRNLYDFRHIQEWSDADKLKKFIEAKYKSAFNSYQRNITPIDDETGEVLPSPKVTYGKPSIVLKEKKK